MLKFLKSIFGSAPDNQITLTFAEIPAWLDEREKAALDRVSAEVQEPMNNIRNAAANLQLIVNNLNGADQDPETHPKIKSIAKNSLPLFLRAMNTSLAKEFPEEPEAFYTTAVECVKGCLNAVRGQGRYLAVAFPDEMKATRTGIDAIGHEINAMTKSLGTFKSEMSGIQATRAAYAAVLDARNDLERSIGKEERIKTRIAELTGNLEKVSAEAARLFADPSLVALESGRAQYAELAKQRDSFLRNYVSLTMTASHVFRKAEKIAIKKNLTKEVHALKDAMTLLSDHEVASPAAIVQALDSACPVVNKMVEDGDILLKNKEERAAFSDAKNFSVEVCVLCTQYHDLEKQCREAEEALLSHPVVTRQRSLEREKEQLDGMRLHEETEHQDLLLWRSKLKSSVPLLEEELVKKLKMISGETVQFQINEPARG